MGFTDTKTKLFLILQIWAFMKELIIPGMNFFNFFLKVVPILLIDREYIFFEGLILLIEHY